MPDLLAGDGTRSFFRISELAACDHVISHRIAGTKEHVRHFPNALEIGKALEPVVNSFLLWHGLSLAFYDDEQLEVALQDPYCVGHPDGLIYVNDMSDLSDWAQKNLPVEALAAFATHHVLLSEVKTMGDETWQKFVRGGIRVGAFTKKYSQQINGYMRSFNDVAGYEIWPDYETTEDGGGADSRGEVKKHVYGSTSFRRFLREHNFTPPTATLIIALNTATKEYAFEYIEMNPAEIEPRLAELEVVSTYLHRGELAPPNFDGRAPDCFFCPFTAICPATLQILPPDLNLSSLIDLGSSSETADLLKLDETAHEYKVVDGEIKALEARKKNLRKEIEESLFNAGRIYTDRYALSMSEIAGRATIDMDALKGLANEYGFEIPMKVGMGHTRVRIQPLFGPTHEREE